MDVVVVVDNNRLTLRRRSTTVVTIPSDDDDGDDGGDDMQPSDRDATRLVVVGASHLLDGDLVARVLVVQRDAKTVVAALNRRRADSPHIPKRTRPLYTHMHV